MCGYSIRTPGPLGKYMSYSAKGRVRAYLQYKQAVPEGIERIGLWPNEELFDYLGIPAPGEMKERSKLRALKKKEAKPAPQTETEGTPKRDDQRMTWWREARFGMFVHFGFYSEPTTDRKMVGMNTPLNIFDVPTAKYGQLASEFNPTEFDAAKLVGLAKRAGMKYLVFTTKHHDGLCNFDTPYTDFDVIDATPLKRDLCKELADECRRQGIKICWYHSILDWYHPDRLEFAKHHTCCGERFDEYVKNQLYPQCEELLKKYGPIGVMWFDGEWTDRWSEEKGRALYDHLRKIQPEVIINDRVGRGRQITRAERRKNVDDTRGFAGDFGTPENAIPLGTMPGFDWETCMTMNDHWHFSRADNNWKSAEVLIRMLVDVASKGGNFLLNIGPTDKGVVPKETVERLEAVGRWMDVNGQSIHGTSASVLPNLPWGRCTVKPGKLFLHVFDWPADGRLQVPGLNSPVSKAYLLADKQCRPLAVAPQEQAVTVTLPKNPVDPAATVVVLEITE